MRPVTLSIALSALLTSLAAAQPSAPPADQGRPDCWLKTPTVSVMTGFIYEPLKPYTIQQWMENLGDKFDPDQWVREFKSAGASHLIFYDKWIDGLVFHDTRTTGFKTKKDFLAELAPACRRGGLPLVIYFNAVSDGNPEFDQWSLLDRSGKPIVFGQQWPTRYQTLHSPFREKALEQTRELMSRYGPLHGLWHDIFHERLDTTSTYTAAGYEKMFGEPFAKATGPHLHQFHCRTLAGWLEEAAASRRQNKQDLCLFTANGSGSQFLAGGLWADLVGSRLEYFYNEGHHFPGCDQLARMAWVLPRPLEIGLLLNSSWFTPMEGAPPRSHMSDRAAIATTAITVCQGAAVNWALTPGHGGALGQDLQRARSAGAWFARVKPFVQGAEPYADVAIVLGVQETGCPGLPKASPFWPGAPRRGAWDQALAIADQLQRRGVFSRLLYANPLGTTWPKSLGRFRAILVPELATLDQPHLDALRQYVQQGGRLIAFAHAGTLDPQGRQRPQSALADMLGARLAGHVTPPRAKTPSRLQADSEYNEQFGVHVLGGLPGEAWASDGTPMPHWVEVTLPQTTDVARVVLVNRQGPYQITDFEVEIHRAGQWSKAAAVAAAKTREMVVKLDPPAPADKVRIRILKELYQGKDRQWADLGQLRIYDKAGHEWARSEPARLGVELAGEELTRLAAGASLAWPAAARTEPTSARAMATLQTPAASPAILRRDQGRGQAYLLAAGDAVIERDDATWSLLAGLAGGEPTLTICDSPTRCRIILTRCGDAHVLHLVDPQSDQPAQAVKLSLLPGRLGDFTRARLIEQDKDVPLVTDGPRTTLTVTPDPVATLVLTKTVAGSQ